MPLGTYLLEKVGDIRMIPLLSGLIASAGAILAISVASNFLQFMIIFCVSFGISAGLSYTVPLKIGWDHFPDNKGLVSGLILGGYGLGSFIFNIFCTLFVNPKNLNVEKDGLYAESVAENVPQMIKHLAILWGILVI